MSSVSSDSQSSTILIIDDAVDNRLLLASQLRSGNFNIISADNGSVGLRLAQEYRPDLILLDVMMPDTDGFTVCRELKSNPNTSNIPVIMLTALRDISYRLKGIEAGADEFLSRPHNREELLLRVKSLVQLKRARDRLETERNNLKLLHDVSQATLTNLNIDEIITNIITYTQKAVGATKGTIIVIGPDGDVQHKILVRAATGIRISAGVTKRIIQDGFAGWVWHNRQADIVADTTLDKRWIALIDDADPAGSAIGVPLIEAGGAVLGLIILTHPQKGYFTESHLKLLMTIAGQVTVALQNARLFAQVNEQRHKLMAVLEQSNEAIVTTDEQQRVALFNHAAELLFNIDAEQVIGKPIDSLQVFAPLTEFFDQDEPVTEEVLLDDGRIVSVSMSPIEGVGLIAVMQDVTERILAEARRLESERREKEALREIFGRYISPSLLEHAIADAPGILEQGRRWAVILFADLRNHSQMVAAMRPNDALDWLNEFFDHMTEIIHRFEGTIIDLIGDELEVGFNVPIDQPDAATRALRTAIEMQRRFNMLRSKWYRNSGVEVGLGIGIDQGNVVIGRVGSRTRMNLAMVGEAVNTAHNLVDLAQDSDIVISEDFYELIKDDEPLHGIQFCHAGILGFSHERHHQVHIYRAQVKRSALVPAQALL